MPNGLDFFSRCELVSVGTYPCLRFAEIRPKLTPIAPRADEVRQHLVRSDMTIFSASRAAFKGMPDIFVCILVDSYF